MVATIIISLITCLILILSILLFPKIKVFNKEINTFWIISTIGAIFALLFNCISINEVIDGLFSSSTINPIKILLLFLSMTFLSIFLDEVGFFKFLASLLIRKCKSNQHTLFVMLYILVAILTIFTSNDIVILTFTPFICYFSKNANINPIPYLVAEFAAANTWSMMLIIGNPTNIYLATSAGITFIEYLKVMFIPSVLSGLVQIFIMVVLFNKTLNKTIEIEGKQKRIKDKVSLIIGLDHLIACLILLIVSSYVNLPMWIICVFCAISLLFSISLYYKNKHRSFFTLKQTFIRLPWNLIPFVISMFIIVLSLNKQGITEIIGNMLGDKNIVFNYGIASFLSSNLINNIPMSVLFSTVPNMSNTIDSYKAIYSIIIGSNVGAFLTPIGALAGIMFTDLISRQNIKYSFLSFIKYGLIISIPTLLVALVTLDYIL